MVEAVENVIADDIEQRSPQTLIIAAHIKYMDRPDGTQGYPFC